MSGRSIFFDEWQKCLHAHYLYVLREHDTITEPTLRRVLLNTGLSEAELAALLARAAAPEPSPEKTDASSGVEGDTEQQEIVPDEPPQNRQGGQLSLF